MKIDNILDISDFDITFIDNYYRYVSHEKELLTGGFKTIEALKKYDVLKTITSLELFNKRYITIYGSKHSQV